MSEQFPELNEKLSRFIAAQKLFFVGTAAEQGSVNVSPKGMDSFRVLDMQQVAWLNLTGSGNETAAHIAANSRMTIMFCSFDTQPLILRLYGQAKVIHPRDADWDTLIEQFPPHTGARQIFQLKLDLVQTSCGYAVPQYQLVKERDVLSKWANNKGRAGVEQYWSDKNRRSIDGLDTGTVVAEQAS